MRLIPKTLTRARLERAAGRGFRSADALLFALCLLYLIASSTSDFCPPLLGTAAIFGLRYLRERDASWTLVFINFYLLCAELSLGLYAFCSLFALLFMHVWVIKRLLYKLRQKTLLIAVLLGVFYISVLAINWLICYALDDEILPPSRLYALYFAADFALCALIFKNKF